MIKSPGTGRALWPRSSTGSQSLSRGLWLGVGIGIGLSARSLAIGGVASGHGQPLECIHWRFGSGLALWDGLSADWSDGDRREGAEDTATPPP